MTKGNPPVDKFEAFPVEIAIFEQENQQGETWHNAQVSKTYKDENGNYQKTTNFSQNDLYKLSALVPQAITTMQTLEQKQYQAQSNGQNMEEIKREAQEDLEREAQAQSQSQGQTP